MEGGGGERMGLMKGADASDVWHDQTCLNQLFKIDIGEDEKKSLSEITQRKCDKSSKSKNILYENAETVMKIS